MWSNTVDNTGFTFPVTLNVVVCPNASPVVLLYFAVNSLFPTADTGFPIMLTWSASVANTGARSTSSVVLLL